MENKGAVVIALVFVVLPWVVIAVDAALGLDFGLLVWMLTVFGFGILLLGTLGTPST